MNIDPDYDADGYPHDELDDYYDWLVTQREDNDGD